MPHAAITFDLDQPMRIEEVRLRPLQEGEVLVRLSACGVCHSDLSILNKLYPCPVPVILGHEAAGEVVETGPKVARLAKGDHVVAVWRPSCGSCRYCRAARPHLCRAGDDPTTPAAGRVTTANGDPVFTFLGVGGFAEYTILSESATVRIDPAMPLEKAALLGCAVITGDGAVRHAAGVREGDEVAVFGCGGVGLNVIQAARRQGAAVIAAIDLDEAKLEMARTFGATHLFKGDDPGMVKSLRAVTTERQGVDHAFDAVGHVKVAETAQNCICRGGQVTFVGIAHMRDKVEVPQMMTVLQERRIRGSVSGSANVQDSIPEMVALYQKGGLLLDQLVTRTYTLAEANDAMNDLRTGRNARGVILFQG